MKRINFSRLEVEGIILNKKFNTESLYSNEQVLKFKREFQERLKKIVNHKININEGGYFIEANQWIESVAAANLIYKKYNPKKYNTVDSKQIILDKHCLSFEEFIGLYPLEHEIYFKRFVERSNLVKDNIKI